MAALRAAATANRGGGGGGGGGLTIKALAVALGRAAGAAVKTHVLRGRLEVLANGGRVEALKVGGGTVFRILE